MTFSLPLDNRRRPSARQEQGDREARPRDLREELEASVNKPIDRSHCCAALHPTHTRNDGGLQAMPQTFEPSQQTAPRYQIRPPLEPSARPPMTNRARPFRYSGTGEGHSARVRERCTRRTGVSQQRGQQLGMRAWRRRGTPLSRREAASCVPPSSTRIVFCSVLRWRVVQRSFVPADVQPL